MDKQDGQDFLYRFFILFIVSIDVNKVVPRPRRHDAEDGVLGSD